MRKPQKSEKLKPVRRTRVAPTPPEAPTEIPPAPPEVPRFRAYTQVVPPPLTPEDEAEVADFIRRYDAMQVGRGPAKSELFVGDDGTILTPEAAWIHAQGWTPLEFLVNVYRQPFLGMGHRINAAKALLEYVHKPQPRVLGSDPDAPLLVNTVVPLPQGKLDVSKLTDAQLTELEKLLGHALTKD